MLDFGEKGKSTNVFSPTLFSESESHWIKLCGDNGDFVSSVERDGSRQFTPPPPYQHEEESPLGHPSSVPSSSGLGANEREIARSGPGGEVSDVRSGHLPLYVPPATLAKREKDGW